MALTRARDRLYVAGFEGGNAPPPDCWYNLIRDGLADRLQEATTADGRIVWRHRERADGQARAVTAKARGLATAAAPAAGLGQSSRRRASR